MNASAPTSQRPLASVLVFAALIVCVAMGIRHSFGLFLTPMSMEHQWNREVFSFAPVSYTHLTLPTKRIV